MEHQPDFFVGLGLLAEGICKSMERVIRATDHAIQESRELRNVLRSEVPPAPDDPMTGDLFDQH